MSPALGLHTAAFAQALGHADDADLIVQDPVSIDHGQQHAVAANVDGRLHHVRRGLQAGLVQPPPWVTWVW